MEHIRIGLMGGGLFALRRARYFSQVEAVSVTAGWSRRPDHRLRLAQETGAHPVEDWRRLATQENVDAVIVSTPHIFHFEQALACLEAGKHVLVETPICLEYDALRRLAARARSTRRVLHHGMQKRFHPEHDREVDELRRIAPLVHAECFFTFEGGPQRPWYRDPGFSGGAAGFVPWAASDLLEAFGEVKDVDGWASTASEVETLSMRVRFTRGGEATVTVGTGVDVASLFTGTVVGEGGILHWGPGGPRRFYERRWDSEGEALPEPTPLDAVEQECRAFVEEIRGRRDPAPFLELDLRILQAVSSARRRAERPTGSAPADTRSPT